ncbi:MAG: hypothetical protein FWC78_04350 [Defluviitaleaceae bacterium]|nr:hypothetical protein [Defluviitaleaceae bacterium]
MKNLDITWEVVHDPTGYLFSFAKALSCAVKNSPWQAYGDDIIATSGFAFRMWVAEDLCASATSIWAFDEQKPWVESGGISCGYAGRYWGQEDIEEVKRLEAISIIKTSIDAGIPAVAWDIGVPEWGLITGYNDDKQTFTTLAVNGQGQMSYCQLGQREIPILSVLTITGETAKPKEAILADTLKLAAAHLTGQEWCDNAKGLKAYPALIKHFEGEPNPEASWNLEYFLGTYGALKYYAWQYLKKAEAGQLAELYEAVYKAWQEAFSIKTSEDFCQPAVCKKIAELLKSAYKNEKIAVELMV